ncbi:MAG: hypothetical protein JO280_15645 [Mycobacteriaceae bacterium]|nr:hypothetical protein [Mycobacteriaceae bacterium]
MTPSGLPSRWDLLRPVEMLASLWSTASNLPPVSAATEVGYRTLFMTLRRLIVGRTLSVQLDDGELTLTVTEFDSSLDMLGLSVGQLGDVRIAATELCWDDVEFDCAVATLHNVHLRPGTPPVLVAAPVELSLQLPASLLRELVKWAMPRFTGEIGDDGVARLYWARQPAFGNLEIDARLDGSTVWLKPRGVAVMGRRLPLPARAPAYPVRLPNLPHGLQLTGVTFGAGSLRLSGTVPEWRMDIPRARLEDIIGQLSSMGGALNLTKAYRWL